MAYINDLSAELEEEVSNSPATAAPKLLDLVQRLLSERHAYRCVLEPIAYKRCESLSLIQGRSHDVCKEFVLPADD